MNTYDTALAALLAASNAIDTARAAYDAAPSAETLAGWDAAIEAHRDALDAYRAAVAAL